MAVVGLGAAKEAQAVPAWGASPFQVKETPAALGALYDRCCGMIVKKRLPPPGESTCGFRGLCIAASLFQTMVVLIVVVSSSAVLPIVGSSCGLRHL